MDTEIPAPWTRRLFARACFRSPVEVASVNSPRRQKTVLPRRRSRSAGAMFTHTGQNQSHPLEVLQWEMICWEFLIRGGRGKADRKSAFTARIIPKSRSATSLNFAGVEGDLIHVPKCEFACGSRRGRGAVDSWTHIPFSPIQSHDNTEQARIYPAKLKHIVPRRQSAIIAGLNKCKILTGTNASNWSRTRGYISPLCSSPLPGMYLCSLAPDHPGRVGEARPAARCAARPRAPTSSGWEAISISNGIRCAAFVCWSVCFRGFNAFLTREGRRRSRRMEPTGLQNQEDVQILKTHGQKKQLIEKYLKAH